MQRGVVKLENGPVAVSKVEQQLLDELQEGRVVGKFCADPVEDVWGDQGCVGQLYREHHNRSTTLEHYLSCFGICLQASDHNISQHLPSSFRLSASMMLRTV